jgi:hypothetical protein
MKRILLTALLALSLGAPCWAEDKLVDQLDRISYTVRNDRSSGSGVAFTRKVGDHAITLIHTAGHCIDNLRKVREIIDANGNKKTVVEYGDAHIVREFYQDGRRIGETKLDAKVLKCSESENGEDLAILQIRQKDFLPEDASVVFYDGEIPGRSTELYHVGSMLGEPNSLTTGIVSQVGRVLDLGANGKTFDQCECTTMPGSSGGGIFLKSDGRCIGLLVRGAGEGFGLFVPVRRMREWARSAKVEWAFDRNVPMPSEEDLAKLPIEDSSVNGSSKTSDADREFPFLIAEPKQSLDPRVFSPCPK